MATRLDRLLVLLDTGSTPVTRKVAAQQVGEVQKLHPHELYSLLQRVHGYLKNSSWDTRIAAAQAVEAIVKNVPEWKPVAIKVEEDSIAKDTRADRLDNQLSFESFNIRNVLQQGESLLGSAGDEFEIDEDTTPADSKEVLARERLQLKRKLGLNTPWASDCGIDDIVDDEDLIVPQKKIKHFAERHMSIESLASQSDSGVASPSHLSTREKNKAIRRAKKLAKQRSKELQEPGNGEPITQNSKSQAPQKAVRMSSVVVEQPGTDTKVVVDSVAEHDFSFAEAENWPFENFCANLCQELFDKAWEVRHGAASGLREIIKIHGHGAGKMKNTSTMQMEEDNCKWLEDVALRLLCVFALDRFGDFIADQVVAPVIETCAQTLGAVLHHMTKAAIRNVLSVLVTLLSESEWQVRHGGLLGLKYMLAVRKDMTDELLPQVLPYICQGLQDGDDDVRAVASSALVPVAEELVAVMPFKVPMLLTILWETLHDLDDLTASTSSIMALLSSLLYHHRFATASDDDISALTRLVPRVWRFLHHNISSVRSAALKTLDTLLSFATDKDKKVCSWLQPILREHLIHLFQRFILEPNEELINAANRVWTKSIEASEVNLLLVSVHSLASLWFALMVHPADVPIDPSLLAMGSHSLLVDTEKTEGERLEHSGSFLGGSAPGHNASEREDFGIKARSWAARALGPLLMLLYTGCPKDNDALTAVFHGILQMISSSSATHRLAGAMILLSWADSGNVSCSETLRKKLHQILSEQVIYDELVPSHHKMQADVQNLIMVFREEGIDISLNVQPGCYTIDTAQELAGNKFEVESGNLPSDSQTNAYLKRSCLVNTINQLQKEYQKHSTRVLSTVAATVIALKVLPEKLNPVIRPLMDSIKREENRTLQFQAAQYLAKLLVLCVERKPCPNAKISKNLSSFVCCDPTVTPKIMGDVDGDASQTTLHNNRGGSLERTESNILRSSKTYGILSLNMKERETNKALKRGRLVRSGSKTSGAPLNDEDQQSNSTETKVDREDEVTRDLVLQRTGGELALCQISEFTKGELPDKLPSLWDICFTSIRFSGDANHGIDNLSEEKITALITSLRTLEVMAPSLDFSLITQIKECLPDLVRFLKYPVTVIRHMAARCFGALCRIMTVDVMHVILKDVFPLLGVSDQIIWRQGAIEAITNIVDSLKMELLPYIVLLIVPVLGRMSDQVPEIRATASSCFATLIQLIPLEVGIPDPPQLSQELVEQRRNERRFLEQLLDGSKIDSYRIPVHIKAELRKYQQDGVNWLAFLNKYKLHGILCDDMGLGKTLQSICVIAGDHALRAKRYEETGNEDCKSLASLVICPPTLTGHWCYEVQKFCKKEDLSALHYYGSPSERQRLQNELKKHNLVVASYDIVRNDCEFFLSVHWNYCILDEGHIIKNSKTKLSYVIKKLKANHRLILSGTPIQNNVLELWALFDFLLPGFLGTEKQFTARYGKPILLSRDAKSSSKEQEAGVLAMEALHRQVLPFILRRMKEDVLQDLPPKIIQDFYCDLSQIQMRLYEDFAKSKAKKCLVDSLKHVTDGDTVASEKGSNQSTHVFQALQYLRKVCNHPSLVLKPSHPEYHRIMDDLQQMKSSIHEIHHATKLVALKQLLLDCGIGVGGSGGSSSDSLASGPVVSQHRALIFCQLRSMLDIVENDLLKNRMPTVTYLRLDGSTPAGSRHEIVQRFNDDPSIDVLLLTTHVGGLGLNLTGADTVIFVEHDWNPTKDLQAMDRAHRIGQKKVVNVYRLITRGTLEEKIMGLQKFKLSIANTVITQDNSSLQSMDTNQLLDLFSMDTESTQEKKGGNKRSEGKASMKSLLEDIGELWDEKQYETEYDLDTFMSSF